MWQFQQNETVPIDVWALNSSNTGVTGAALVLTLKRVSDGWFWNGAAFQSGVITVNMTEVDASGFPGLYRYSFNSSGLADDTYTFKITTVTAAVVNDPWADEFRVGGYVDDIASSATIAAAVRTIVIESEGNYTIQQALSIILSALAGRTTDDGLTFKTPNNNATRIAAAVNTDNERTAITLTPSA